MAWLAWFSYVTVFFFCMLCALSPQATPNGFSNGESSKSIDSLNGLCVDNIRTQSWWTYVVCLKKSVLQVHMDPRRKQITDRMQLGEFQEPESTPTKHVYRTKDASCSVKGLNGENLSVHRTTIVSLECCDAIVHLMRQSRHTSSDKYTTQSLDQYYGVPAHVADEAAEEIKSVRRKAGGGPALGYQSSTATATSDAYISNVEEKEACQYDVTVCSQLLCSTKKDNKLGPSASEKKTQRSSTTKNSSRKVKKISADASTATLQDNLPNTQPTAPPPLMTPSMTSSLETAAETVKVSDAILPRVTTTTAPIDRTEQLLLREKSRQMFYHAYDSYMLNAFPEAELCPISCTGGKFDLIKIPMVTLIDTLDTLVILGNHSEFRRVVDIVSTGLPDFALDVNVSVFETTIRVLGGLLAAHLMAIDPKLAIYEPSATVDSADPTALTEPYDGKLLKLAVDLGERLMPSFDTKTGIPYGTVNLLYGVPIGETKIASTAGAGSLLVEFQVLSHLSGRESFGQAAFAAMKGLYMRKSSIGLLGKHINTETGQWSESLSGVGSNADSFYEYLLKAYLLFRNKELYGMFSDSYRAIKRFVMVNERWFTEVDMFSGKLARKRYENLDAFWPGVEAMLGFTTNGADQLNTFYSVWQDLGFLPEEIDYSQWQAGKGAINGLYPLRPELIESTYHQYRTTGDRSWLLAGKLFLESVESVTRTSCGYASVTDVNTMTLADTMPSFFLSETCKYLFLLFDEDNFVNHRPYIFSTEAHPFDAMQVHFGDVRGLYQNSTCTNCSSGCIDGDCAADNERGDEVGASKIEGLLPATTAATTTTSTTVISTSTSSSTPAAVEKADISSRSRMRKRKSKGKESISILDEVRQHHQKMLQTLKSGKHVKVVASDHVEMLLQKVLSPMAAAAGLDLDSEGQGRVEYLPMKCRKPRWWDRSTSYDAEYLQEVNSNLRNEEFKGKVSSPKRKNSNSQRPSPSTSSPSSGDESVGRKVIRLRSRQEVSQLSHTSFILIDLIEQLRIWQSIATTGSAPTTTTYEVGDDDIPVDWRISKLKWFETPSHFFSTERCSPADQPTSRNKANNKLSTAADKSSERDENILKTVRVSLGSLGDFLISVFTDGFFIKNENDKSTVEISNVGRSLVLARETVGDESEVLMADTDHRTVARCRVGVTSSDSGHTTTLFNRPCSIANFGPTLLGEKIDMLIDDVLPVLETDKLMCHPTKHAQFSDTLHGNWFQRAVQQYLGATTSPEAKRPNTNENNNILALVDRGGCLFEEKAENAKLLGAHALIVRNTEDAVFIMAGKKDVTLPVEITENPNLSEPESEVIEEENLPEHLPVTVMLAKSDGTRLAEVFQQQQKNVPEEKHSTHKIRISSDVSHMLLNTEIMGDVSYPKIFIQPRLIMVVGSGEWVTLLKAVKGEDWQLYLMSKEDMHLTHNALIPPHNVVTAEGGQFKSLPSSVLRSPLSLYRYNVMRKCPSFVKGVSGNQVLI